MFADFKAWLVGSLKSWTMWFNSAVLSLVALAGEITTALPQLQAVLTPQMYGKLLLGVTVVNILLRLKTKEPVNYK